VSELGMVAECRAALNKDFMRWHGATMYNALSNLLADGELYYSDTDTGNWHYAPMRQFMGDALLNIARAVGVLTTAAKPPAAHH